MNDDSIQETLRCSTLCPSLLVRFEAGTDICMARYDAMDRALCQSMQIKFVENFTQHNTAAARRYSLPSVDGLELIIEIKSMVEHRTQVSAHGALYKVARGESAANHV